MNSTTLGISVFILILIGGCSIVYFSGGFALPYPASTSTRTTLCATVTLIQNNTSTVINSTTTITITAFYSHYNGTRVERTYDQFGSQLSLSCDP